MPLRTFLTVTAAALLASACAVTPPTAPATATPASRTAASSSSTAQVVPSPAFVARAEELVAAFNSKTPVSTLFVTTITEEQRKGLRNADATLMRMRDRLGPIVGIDRIEAETPYKGRIHVNLESRQTSFRIGLESAPPHRLLGMEL